MDRDRDGHDDAAQQQEWLSQDSLAYGAVLGVGVVVVQPFLTGGTLDLTAIICVVAFAAAIPVLAALALVNRQESFRRSRATGAVVYLAKPVAQGLAFVGLVAAFWHIAWYAGVVFLVAGAAGLLVYVAGYHELESG